MSNTTLTHKIRNPKQLSNWLELWTADIVDADNYTIIPSDSWDFPINISSLSTTSADIASYSDKDECLILDKAIISASLTPSGQASLKTFSLETEEDHIATYESENECLVFGSALINAMLTSSKGGNNG